MRDATIDRLRTLCLALLVLAHVGAPTWLWQARNFDIPLLVVVAGIAYGQSREQPYGPYVWKRVGRLVGPAWLFCASYAVVIALTGWPIPLAQMDVLRSVLLSSGYTWLLGVLLLVALVAPLCRAWHRAVRDHGHFLIGLGVVLIWSEALRWLVVDTPWGVVGYVLPYGLLFTLGLRLPTLPRPFVFHGSLCALVVCGVLGLSLSFPTGTWLYTQAYKYPPGIYYLSYALGMGGLAWVGVTALPVTLRLDSPMQWISRHSLALYLWHLPFVDALMVPWALKYPLVIAGAVGMTWLQGWVVAEWKTASASPGTS
jgi:fucose 4-O-acetylase-like acetyltransferase